jgi:fructokinase
MTAPVIAVGGEALIDLIADGARLHPHPGGGPFNTAVSLGRLGVPVAFVGRLSRDPFGRLLDRRLAESGVDTRYVLRGDAPTPLALVHPTSDGDHDFRFYLSGTAYADVTVADLPQFEPELAALHVGTLALATDPPAAAFEHLIEREWARRLVVVDPNIRPAVCGERDAYVRRFESWAGRAHVVKLSDDDADWLFPGVAYEAVVETILARGPQLVVLTSGADGVLARTASASIRADSPRVTVVDTVGAGDAFGAGLLRRLWETGRLGASAICRIDDAELADVVSFAAAVGALQCSRAGATPPTLDEVQRFLGVSRSPRRWRFPGSNR